MRFVSPMPKPDFENLMVKFPDLMMEREKNGTVILMSPVKKSTGKKEAKAIIYLGIWSEKTGLGEVYSSSTMFDLPDGSSKSPDCAWLSNETLAALPDDEDESDASPVVPDFVVEVRSKSDLLKKVQDKMQDVWMANGVRLGWLIDPFDEKVHIYRQGQEPEIRQGFAGKFLSGEDVLPGFRMALDKFRRRKLGF